MSKFTLKVMAVLTVMVMLVMAIATPIASAKNPVVFVHGWGGMKTQFGPMVRYLSNQGWPTSHLSSIQYSNPFGSSINNAHQLSGFVNNKMAGTGRSEVDLVAHSMGGLSTRYYIKNLGGVNNVGALVTCGSPHTGTPSGYVGQIMGEGGREMIPGSTFLRQLNSGDLTPGSTKYTSIFSYQDIVVPWRYSRMGGDWNNIGVWWLEHNLMLNSRTVHRHVQRNLTN